MSSEQYVEFPEIIHLDLTDSKVLVNIGTKNIIQRIEFPEYLGEVELFHDDYSLGKTTAGFLTFPSPESSKFAPLDTVTDDIFKHGVIPGLAVYRLPGRFYVKIHLKYKYGGYLHVQKVPLILWKSNILQINEKGDHVRMKYSL
jgi:hypothetical protein